MATVARCRCAGVACRMTGDAGDVYMSSGQREVGQIVVDCRGGPGRSGMTDLTLGRKIPADMIRVFRRSKARLVAAVALGRRPGKAGSMTGLALHRRVGAG